MQTKNQTLKLKIKVSGVKNININLPKRLIKIKKTLKKNSKNK